MKVFGIGQTRSIADEVCKGLGIELSFLNEEKFPDGELKITPRESVEDAEVFVFHSLGGNSIRSVNDRLCELYFFLSTLRDHGALRVTAVIPYLAYARSDQRKVPFDPVINKYVAQMIERSGVHRIISLDVHNVAAFENAFGCPTINLEAASLFSQYVAASVSNERSSYVVLSPDIGGINRAEKFRKQLESTLGVVVTSAFLEKFRSQKGLTGGKLVGHVQGKRVLIIDDMISTGETILRAVNACKNEGADSIKVFATHGLFTRNKNELLNSSAVEEFVVTDGHPALTDLGSFKKLKILSCAPLFASAIAGRIFREDKTREDLLEWRRDDRTGD